MSTALQLITDAMLKAGIIASGDVLTSEESNDGLRGLNDLLENLSLEPQSVYGRATESFATVAGQATYTIGPSGNWNTTRPVRIHAVGYARLQGVDYPIDSIDPDTYALITLKTQPGVPERFLYINEMPLGTVTLWPVPDQAYTIGLNIDRVLTAPATLVTNLILPPGYELAIKCLLADMLAPEYGVTLPPAVAAQASRFKADMKRANRQQRRARFDDVPGVYGGAGFNDWRTGS